MLLTFDKIIQFNFRRAYTLLAILFLQVQLVPLIAASQNQTVKFNHLQTDAGLSQSNVLCILQDSRGFMWFGTQKDLFTVYQIC